MGCQTTKIIGGPKPNKPQKIFGAGSLTHLIRKVTKWHKAQTLVVTTNGPKLVLPTTASRRMLKKRRMENAIVCKSFPSRNCFDLEAWLNYFGPLFEATSSDP